MSITIKRQVHFKAEAKGQKRVRRGKRSEQPTTRVPRVARLMALAIHFDDLLRQGKVRDYAEIARAGQVTRARVTQIMNLLSLAPAIQEEMLSSTEAAPGGGVVTERALRNVARVLNWSKQRRALSMLAEAR
jgi:hypothetical protein